MTPQSWYEDELFFVLLYEEEEEEGELMEVICFLWRPGEAEAVRGCCFTGDWNMSEVSPGRDLEIEIFTERKWSRSIIYKQRTHFIGFR